MRVTYNWLKDFVDIKLNPQALADKLTMAGLEVTSLEAKSGDFIFEIEVTSNRPDLLSVIGIAREVAAILGHRSLVVGSRSSKKSLQPTTYNRQPFSIKIQDKKDCPLYTAKIIKDVKVGPSPHRLKERLELVGVRAVNNIVDITNYVLWEWGEPLHAFDLDKLSQEAIIVRRAKQNEAITTIDGERRILSPEVLVIADQEKSLALAGIMGGKDSEVSENTKNVLLEAAIFNPIVIRRARQRLGLQSESSYRFERGIDPEIVERASGQATKLIQQICGGKYLLAKSAGLPKVGKPRINLAAAYVQKILGAGIAPAKIKKILTDLEFKVKKKAKNNFLITVPSHRQDVNLAIDLIEEIARIFGYENLPSSLPKIMLQSKEPKTADSVALTKNILVALGLNEVNTYSLIRRSLLKGFPTEDTHPIEILNPLSQEQEILRPTIIPSLVRCVAYNLNQKQEYVNIFEIAKRFSQTGRQSKEELVLGIALCGIRELLLAGGLIKDEVGPLHLKGILETLFSRLGIKDYSFKAEGDAYIGVYVDKEKIGIAAELAPQVLANFEIKNRAVVAAEISLEKIFPAVNLSKKFTSPPLYPGISRDISVIVQAGISAEQILGAIRKQAGPWLKELKIADYYKGKQIPAGFKGLTISCFYRADERTLTEAEINPLYTQLCAVLTEQLGVKIR